MWFNGEDGPYEKIRWYCIQIFGLVFYFYRGINFWYLLYGRLAIHLSLFVCIHYINNIIIRTLGGGKNMEVHSTLIFVSLSSLLSSNTNVEVSCFFLMIISPDQQELINLNFIKINTRRISALGREDVPLWLRKGAGRLVEKSQRLDPSNNNHCLPQDLETELLKHAYVH